MVESELSPEGKKLSESPVETGYIAIPFESPYPDSEVLGLPILGLLQNQHAEDFLPILQKYGFDKIEKDHWYLLQMFLDIHKDIAHSKENVTVDFAALGVKVAQLLEFPPDVKTIPASLDYLQKVMKSFTRNVPIEYGYPYEIVGEKHLLVIHNTPLPSDTFGPYLWAISNRFRPNDEGFRVRALETTSFGRTVFEIEWGDEKDIEDD
jgi:hypothetical protein